MIYGFYLQNVVLFRIKPNSEDPNKEPTWWDKIRNQEWFTFDSKLKKPTPPPPSLKIKSDIALNNPGTYIYKFKFIFSKFQWVQWLARS